MSRQKAMITGASGAVGSVLARFLQEQDWEVVAWDRTAVSLTDLPDIRSYLEFEFPDVLFHLATDSESTGIENESWVVNVAWSENLARLCRQLGIQFVFTSSVMVFTNDANGPFTVEAEPDAAEGYGYEKRTAEQRVLKVNPRAVIARLGWQIGDAPGSNNMIDFFARQMEEQGEIRASRQWYPATSFLADTAVSLTRLSNNGRGLYLVDANERWNFYEIATALNELHGRPWRIIPTDDFVYDQRMIDGRSHMPSLRKRLSTLPS
ncbi:MAG: sugar nucleotide-binding protein [Ardenticatenaceae bacterium]|nr:sugar nucleotide-binding protein [Anaerolineales bacterium]MCB8920207.1 sugar nucleotide-binding protein [Ardenticatenaceae bacterium]MCB9004880.1 sugar nucleotide-binding protein [Ardenticatenaceae bacterium]